MGKRKKRFGMLREIGPAAFVTAAFIGPGTLTTCTLAGASWGYSLLWGLLFSVVATLVLQEMASRLGIIGRMGLGEAISASFPDPFRKAGAVTLVILAIGIGNAAYETGNITGASIGLETITGLTTAGNGPIEIRIWPFITGSFAFILLISGSYRILERILITLVIIMSITFISTAILVKPNLSSIAAGFFIPRIPAGSAIMLIGLIGTTVVPYNLFLHASAAKEKWNKREDLSKSRIDSFVAIGIGGIISSAIVITSSAAFFGTGKEITGVAELGEQLQPLLGPVAKYFMAVGIFSAGVSSAVTAPLAAAYAISGVLGLQNDMKAPAFRLIWISVLITGVIFATFGLRPVRIILMAQFANGLLLPILAVFLLKVMNNSEILGEDKNGRLTNLVGLLIIMITFLLGLKSIFTVTGLIG
jgi:NRAMP (natural resistance-associated macrophage protein)-like metal ion transporter